MSVLHPAASNVVLVTGASGFIGGQVAASLVAHGWRVRTTSRRHPSPFVARDWVQGDLTDAATRRRAVHGVAALVHCAAMVGDRGELSAYRAVNGEATRALWREALAAGCRRFVHVSSLGVYPARDHYGTDEAVPPSLSGIDAYTLSKIEAEAAVRELALGAGPESLRTIVLRPGFTYGAGDRSVVPRLVAALRRGRVAYIGSGEQKLNNTGIENFCAAVRLALEKDVPTGEAFNITDARLVSKTEFIGTIARHLGLSEPRIHVPRPLALALTKAYEALPFSGAGEPLLSMARYKFMALNLEFSIAKARRLLGYEPRVDFQDGIVSALAAVLDEEAA